MEKKTIGELIDEIGITNQKIWALVERVEAHTNTVEEAWKLNDLVKRRSQLRSAINAYFGERSEIKVYGSDRQIIDSCSNMNGHKMVKGKCIFCGYK